MAHSITPGTGRHTTHYIYGTAVKATYLFFIRHIDIYGSRRAMPQTQCLNLCVCELLAVYRTVAVA